MTRRLTGGHQCCTSSCMCPPAIFHPQVKATHQELGQAEPAPAFTYADVISLKTLPYPAVRCLSLWLKLMETWARNPMPMGSSVLGVMPAKVERWSKPPQHPQVESRRNKEVLLELGKRSHPTQKTLRKIFPLNMTAPCWSSFAEQVKPLPA